MPPKLDHDLASSRAFEDATASFAALAAAGELDPALLALSGASGSAQIDPQLFAIESVVQDVRRGRVEDLERDLAIDAASQDVADASHPDGLLGDDEAPDEHIAIDDDGIDPALREIVNSLTNAQQSHHPIGDEERERLDRERLHSTLQSTLEDFTHHSLMGQYNAIFSTSFPQSPTNLVLPLEEPEATPIKRGRGRPKGSKNKPKPGAPPPPPPPPKRKRGRPPKIRTAEELEEMERRQQEKELGIQRKRGRPRKYPEIGLVREMRLKKNRAVFAEKLRQQEEREQRAGGKEYEYKGDEYEEPMDVELGQQVAAAVARQPVQDGDYWPYSDPQTLMDVVGSSLGVEASSDVNAMGADIMSGDQSDEMRGVFALPDVPEAQQ
ncbi:hypothetical protein CC85DRAFT_311419 [Cutaneotrichosporon oleaginosum]|uniref:Uncharacterized protein n=1 Tax=Cutaneotrichosporon oleaginosum TaxID=879819 RepID=A0A0J0XSG8_9TREE|nr:uncharacterized protein CC85DRAFT_311419 [Cutaneotrichosporon oleaginosum]KLT44005.1 hypothetical protein CC85DRAFT_311419 [Cutaneotrichosporon oleaginosum]TXT04048.1 hypothetical protein COLE_07745 [Cutaneotrichosporon oleaginosum]